MRTWRWIINLGPYLGGASLSLADCAYATTLFMIEDIASCLNMNAGLSRKIRNWRDALQQADVVQDVIDENRAAIAAWLDSKLSPPGTGRISPTPTGREKAPATI